MVCRRVGSQNDSIYSNIADESSAREVQTEQSRSSRCVVDQKLSMSALSTDDATRPIDPSGPA